MICEESLINWFTIKNYNQAQVCFFSFIYISDEYKYLIFSY